jgi:hypothetical protein
MNRLAPIGPLWIYSQMVNRLRKSLLVYWPYLIVGFAMALIGVVPAILADWGADADTRAGAHWVYVHDRVAHHLMFGRFPTIHVARFFLMAVIWACFALAFRKDERLLNLNIFCGASLLADLGGLLLSGLAEQDDAVAQRATSYLRFYWFRLSDVAIPMGLALTCGAAVQTWSNRTHGLPGRIVCRLPLALIALAGGLMLYEHSLSGQPKADLMSLPKYVGDSVRTAETYANWRKVCRWINENTPYDAVFITPVDQQTFKWYAGRTEVFCWKDIPQDAQGILQWRDRALLFIGLQSQSRAGLMSLGAESLHEIADRFDADHLLVPQFQLDMALLAEANQPNGLSPLDGLQVIYPEQTDRKSTYAVLRICKRHWSPQSSGR